MIGRTPRIYAEVNGRPVAGAFYSLLAEARFRDETGKTADSLTLTFDDDLNQIAPITKGDEIRFWCGYVETGIVDKGLFKVEKPSIQGSVEKGQLYIVTAKAADLSGKIKGDGRRAHKDKTLKHIAQEEAKAAGFEVVVDPALGAHRFDYRLRWDQSPLDFLTRLADEVGGLAKPAGGKLILQQRGSGKSASGQPLAPILIDRSDCSEWTIDPEGRLQYGEVEASWTDPRTGKRRRVSERTGLDGPTFSLREAFTDEERAKRAAKAETSRLNQGTGSGSLTIAGRPEAQAGAPVILTGFRPEANGEWRSGSIEHQFKPGEGGGYTCTVEIKPKNDGKTEKEKDD